MLMTYTPKFTRTSDQIRLTDPPGKKSSILARDISQAYVLTGTTLLRKAFLPVQNRSVLIQMSYGKLTEPNKLTGKISLLDDDTIGG